MRVVVFGASGFLGRHVVAALRGAGHDVTAVVRRAHPPAEAPGEAAGPAVEQVTADITDDASLQCLTVRPEVVVDAAARVPGASTADLRTVGEMFAVNALGALAVAHWAIERGAARIVYCSTLAVVGRPWPVPVTEASPTYPVGPHAGYAASKLAGELVGASLAQGAGVSFAVLRLSALYGVGMAWHGVLPVFVDRALAGQPLRVTAGGAVHADLLHVTDAARAVAAAAERPVSGIVNVASGEETCLAELARLVLRLAGREPELVELVDEGQPSRAVVDTARMRGELGIVPERPLESGVAELVACASHNC